ncbi:MAG: hypothetical protein IPF41_13825 [Flavobacteriales bacterium]|nr:hypothetical protein [Flavobacteriales bacterium]
MDRRRQRRAIALAYEVMHGQVGDRLAHEAKERWLTQIEQGMENAQRSGDRELMRWFLLHSARLPAGYLPWRKRALVDATALSVAHAGLRAVAVPISIFGGHAHRHRHASP